MNDATRMLNDLTIMLTIIEPNLNEVKAKIRIEEVLDKYSVVNKTVEQMDRDLEENIKLYLSSRKMEGLSSSTLLDYERELSLFMRYVDKPTVQVTTSDIRNYLSSNDINMASTTGKKLSILRTFFSWLVNEELLLRNPTSRIANIRLPKRLNRGLTQYDLEVVREGCKTKRQRALVEVMYSTGGRLSEVSGMKRDDVDWSNKSIRVIGKGNKEGIVYLNPKAQYHLKEYLSELEVEENDCEYLFSTMRRPYRRMHNKTIQDEVKKIVLGSGLTIQVTPHDFRRAMANIAIEGGIELNDLQQLLRHESPQTSARYFRTSETRKQQAHKKYVQ